MHYGALVIRIGLNCYSNRYTKIKGCFYSRYYSQKYHFFDRFGHSIIDYKAKSIYFLIDLAKVLHPISEFISIFASEIRRNTL